MGTLLVDGSEVIDDEVPVDPPLPESIRFRLNGLVVDLVPRSLAKPGRDVDAIVSSDDNYLSHSSGVSADLWRAAGRQFIAEQAKLRPTLTLGDVHVTGAGKLPAKHLIHAVTIDLELNRTRLRSRPSVTRRRGRP